MKNCFYITGALLLLITFATVVQATDVFHMTPQGVQYKDLKAGAGETAAAGDVATMHFTGWLDSGGQKGKELYNTRRHGESISFVIGTERVMQGWNEGVTGMRQGGKRLLRVPPSLGYGSRGVEGVIPPDAGLIFIIDLIELEKRSAH